MKRDPLYLGLQRACNELTPRDSEIASYDAKLKQLIYQQILVAARKLLAQGLIHPNLDLEPTCWAVTLLLDQCWHMDGMGNDESQIERERNAVADLIYHALIKAPE